MPRLAAPSSPTNSNGNMALIVCLFGREDHPIPPRLASRPCPMLWGEMGVEAIGHPEKADGSPRRREVRRKDRPESRSDMGAAGSDLDGFWHGAKYCAGTILALEGVEGVAHWCNTGTAMILVPPSGQVPLSWPARTLRA